jgi:hypothetical protein
MVALADTFMGGPVAVKVQAFRKLPLSGMSDDAVYSIEQNLRYLSTTTDQLASELARVGAAIPSLAAVIASITTLAAQVAGRETPVYLTAAGGGSTWDVVDLGGYPNIGAVIIDPNGESNTLNLPVLGADDKAVFTIKCLSGGTVTISGDVYDIVVETASLSFLSIPYAFVADGVRITTYAVTLMWVGSESQWHVIDTAILTA